MWTEERVKQLRQFWTAGLTCSQIAKRFDCGLSRNAVIGKASRLGLDARKKKGATRLYRSGPVSYEEKQRREAERLARRMVARVERRQRNFDGSLPPLTIAETPQPVEFLNLTFDELQRDSCRYPRGENADMRFCGQPRMQGHSYCPHCYSITHYKPHDATPLGRNRWVNYLARAA